MRPYSWGTWKPPKVGGTQQVTSDRPTIPFWSHPLVILFVGFVLVIAVVMLGYHFSDGALLLVP